jgi:hypothetical protein
MPLVGIIDPSHYERAKAKAGRLPNWLTLEEAFLASQAPDPKWSPWTFELIQAALGEHQERATRISTTTLTSACPRSTVLERMEDYIGNLDSMYAALRGTMVHRTLEAYGRLGAIAEGRFYTTIDGIEISGSPDLVTTDTVYDYKVPTDITGVPSFGYPFRHQTEQLMMNAFILRHAKRWDLPPYLKGGLPFDPRDPENHVRHAVIVYLGPKMPKIIEYQVNQEFVTPAGVTKKSKRAYVWSDDEVLNGYDLEDQKHGGFRAKLHIMQHAFDSYPDWPEPWTNPDDGETYTAEQVWGGANATWDCPGPPVCRLPDCLARRRPGMYTWEKPE